MFFVLTRRLYMFFFCPQSVLGLAAWRQPARSPAPAPGVAVFTTIPGSSHGSCSPGPFLLSISGPRRRRTRNRCRRTPMLPSPLPRNNPGISNAVSAKTFFEEVGDLRRLLPRSRAITLPDCSAPATTAFQRQAAWSASRWVSSAPFAVMTTIILPVDRSSNRAPPSSVHPCQHGQLLRPSPHPECNAPPPHCPPSRLEGLAGSLPGFPDRRQCCSRTAPRLSIYRSTMTVLDSVSISLPFL
jgi:hypothetical protein